MPANSHPIAPSSFSRASKAYFWFFAETSTRRRNRLSNRQSGMVRAEEDRPMPMPQAPTIGLTARQRGVLEHLVRASSTAQAIAVRARLVLAAADGTSSRQIAQRLGLARNTV